jgi:hypothetical protein
MRNWIAGAMTVLGTLLVLAGAVSILLRAWWKPVAPAPGVDATGSASAPTVPTGTDLFGTAPAAPPAASAASPRESRSGGLFGGFDAPERLIGWGIVLLVLAAVAAGAIGFDLGASAPAR